MSRWFIVRVLGLLVLSLGIFILPMQSVNAAEIGLIEAIQQRGYLTVGLPPYDTPPAYYLDAESRQLEGFDVDLARGLARALGVELRFDRESTSFNNLVVRAGHDEFDIAIGKLGQSYERLSDAFPIQYLRLRHALLVNRQFLTSLGVEPSDPLFADIFRNSSMRIGGISGSTGETGVRLNFPSSEFVGFSDWDSAQESLMQPDIPDSRVEPLDAIYRDATEIKRIVYQNPVLTLDYVPVIMDDVYEEGSIYLSSAGRDAFSAFIPFYLRNEWGEIKDDREIMNEYSSYYYPVS